jgi:hypothetical protein
MWQVVLLMAFSYGLDHAVLVPRPSLDPYTNSTAAAAGDVERLIEVGGRLLRRAVPPSHDRRPCGVTV